MEFFKIDDSLFFFASRSSESATTIGGKSEPREVLEVGFHLPFTTTRNAGPIQNVALRQGGVGAAF